MAAVGHGRAGKINFEHSDLADARRNLLPVHLQIRGRIYITTGLYQCSYSGPKMPTISSLISRRINMNEATLLLTTAAKKRNANVYE